MEADDDALGIAPADRCKVGAILGAVAHVIVSSASASVEPRDCST